MSKRNKRVTSIRRVIYRTAVLATLFPIFSLVGAGEAQSGDVDRKKAPMELKMIMNPGKHSGSTITFNTESDKLEKKNKAMPELTEVIAQQQEIALEPVAPETVMQQLPQKKMEQNTSVAVPASQYASSPPPDAQQLKDVKAPTIDTETSKATIGNTATISKGTMPEDIAKEQDVFEGTATVDNTAPQTVAVAAVASVSEDPQQVQPEQKQDKIVDPLVSSNKVAKKETPKKERPVKPRYIGYTPSFEMRTGYRQDSTQYSIAGYDGVPNFLSELTWDGIQSFEVGGHFRWSNASKLYMRGGLDIGWILAGEVQDSDYLGNDRTFEYSRSISDTTNGTMFDSNIGAGYRLDIPLTGNGGQIHLMPLIGYGYFTQEYEMTNGKQVVALDESSLGHFSGLQSVYESKWYGPWLGLDLELAFNNHHKLLGGFGYHFVDYHGKGNWNLRSDLQHPVSFKHEASGDGILTSLQYNYTPTEQWSWSLGFTYRDFESEPGDKIAYFADGTSGTVPFNGVEWQSYSITLGLGYNF